MRVQNIQLEHATMAFSQPSYLYQVFKQHQALYLWVGEVDEVVIW